MKRLSMVTLLLASCATAEAGLTVSWVPQGPGNLFGADPPRITYARGQHGTEGMTGIEIELDSPVQEFGPGRTMFVIGVTPEGGPDGMFPSGAFNATGVGLPAPSFEIGNFFETADVDRNFGARGSAGTVDVTFSGNRILLTGMEVFMDVTRPFRFDAFVGVEARGGMQGHTWTSGVQVSQTDTASAAVPEPATITGAILAALTGMICLRRKQ